MPRVQEGAFDPGPPPPEPVQSIEKEPEKPREELRDRALRILREQEAERAQQLDWYGQLAGNADPGDEAMFGVDLAAPGSDQTVVVKIEPPKRLRNVRLAWVDYSNAAELRLTFGDGLQAFDIVQKLQYRGAPAGTVRALREMADRIERELCSPMDRIIARAERARW